MYTYKKYQMAWKLVNDSMIKIKLAKQMHDYKKQKPAERDKIKSAKQTHYSMLMKPAEKKK